MPTGGSRLVPPGSPRGQPLSPQANGFKSINSFGGRTENGAENVNQNGTPEKAKRRINNATEEEVTAVVKAVEPVTCKVACLSWAGSKDGFKKTNQDAYCFMRTKDKKSLLFGVFDGHGPNGHDVSKFMKERVPQILMDHAELLSNPGKAFEDAFLMSHTSITEEASIDCGISGTTAVMAHVFGRKLTVAWAGDSRAVLARAGPEGSLEAIRLSQDHKPELPEEKKRIEASNGSVYQDVNEDGEDVGPFRVWMKRGPMLGLAMSRSLGDSLAHSVGVSAVPEIYTHGLEPRDKFLVLASDGIFEWLSDAEVVDVIEKAGGVDAGVKKLLKLSKSRWQNFDQGSYIDDMTALVVGFTHLSSADVN